MVAGCCHRVIAHLCRCLPGFTAAYFLKLNTVNSGSVTPKALGHFTAQPCGSFHLAPFLHSVTPMCLAPGSVCSASKLSASFHIIQVKADSCTAPVYFGLPLKLVPRVLCCFKTHPTSDTNLITPGPLLQIRRLLLTDHRIKMKQSPHTVKPACCFLTVCACFILECSLWPSYTPSTF